MLNIAAVSATRRRFSICQKRSGCWPGDGVKMTHTCKRQRSNRLQIGLIVAVRSLTRWQGEQPSRSFSVCGNGAAPCQPPTGTCPRLGGFAPSPWARCQPITRGHAVPLHRQEGPTAHPAQSGLQAETTTICLTFLAAHPNLEFTAPLHARYLDVHTAVTPLYTRHCKIRLYKPHQIRHNISVQACMCMHISLSVSLHIYIKKLHLKGQSCLRLMTQQKIFHPQPIFFFLKRCCKSSLSPDTSHLDSVKVRIYGRQR